MKKVFLAAAIALLCATAGFAEDQKPLRSGKVEIGAGVRFLVNPQLTLAWFPMDNFSVGLSSSLNVSGARSPAQIPPFLTVNLENTWYFLTGTISPFAGLDIQTEFQNQQVQLMSILPQIGIDLQTNTPFYAQASWEPFPLFTTRASTGGLTIQGDITITAGIRL